MYQMEILLRELLANPCETTVAAAQTFLDELTRDRLSYAPQIDEAKLHYAQGTDDIEVDDNPFLSTGDDGVWVSAWVWVYTKEDTEEEDNT